LFTDVATQGIFVLSGGGNRSERAVNLADLTVSDLQATPALKIENAGPSAAAPPVLSEKSPLTGYVLAAILALLALEALLLYRRRRIPLEA
jgi:hypothetical protein